MTIAKPDALVLWDDLRARIAACGVVVFLDYDGTLTPIAPRPDLAVLSPSMRNTLRILASRWPTAIVSGRALAQIEELVEIPGLIYAGSHGFDIRGPDLRCQVGREARNSINTAFSEVNSRLHGVKGVLVENKTFSVAVHFRLVPAPARTLVIQTTREVAAHHGLRVTGGKEIVEMRPNIDWDKGAAVRWLSARHPGRIPLYIGDDTTDEDAFRAIASDGIAILVSSAPRETAAAYTLRDVAAVEEFLRRLCEIPTSASA